ncbi:unnamed protein product [Victoria cruziana]
MDSLSTCKEKLQYFRIKELKDVLTQIGLAKQGKKQDLVDRILALLSDDQASKNAWGRKHSVGKEEILKIVDDTYRKMQVHGATDLASKSHNSSTMNIIKPKEEVEDHTHLDTKICCPCGSSFMMESMIQCEDPKCRVWQHLGCVIIPEKPVEGVQLQIPPQHYCEICRLNRADPFWVTLGHPLLPVRWANAMVPTDGTSPLYNVEKTFQLTRADRDFLQKAGHDIQAWCILLNDKVSFRMQWPQFAELQVNGVAVRTTTRPGSQLLGINGRDDGPIITSFSREGINRISLSACDARIFCFGVRLVRRRSVSQVLSLIPKESEGEKFEDALARVRRCVGGGAENAGDSDSDLEVVADTVPVNLRCPMSGSRIKIAGRFKPCVHMGCFDLGTFVELNQRSKKWQCPICLKNYSLESIIIDPYFNCVTTMMMNCGEDVTEIEVRPDGSWRVKNEPDYKDLGLWHLPDGSLCLPTNGELKHDDMFKKQDCASERASLKLGIRKNRNGVWEVSRPEELCTLSSPNYASDEFKQKIMARSSSATGSNRDGEDASVNQDGHFDLINGNELDSAFLDPDIFGMGNRVPNSIPLETDIIVLSDSDEDNRENLNVMPSTVGVVSPERVYETAQDESNINPFTVPSANVTEAFPHAQGLGIFQSGGDDYIWECPQSGAFSFFGTNADVSDPLVDVQQSVARPMQINGYELASETALEGARIEGLASQAEPSISHLNNGINNVLDNPLSFDADDPSLQIFLSPGPVGTSMEVDCTNQATVADDVQTEDWVTLSLGGHNHERQPLTGMHSRQPTTGQENRMEALAETAIFLSRNEENAPADTQRSESPFSPQQHQRSVRRRLYLSIDTDSE